MTKYVDAFSWTESIGRFLAEQVRERPLLHVCSGRAEWRDITLERPISCDRYELSDVRSDWLELPFGSDSFSAVFADPPWNAAYKEASAVFVVEALRVAPVVYLMCPWLYGSARARLTRAYVRYMPGVNSVILLARYCRDSVASIAANAASAEGTEADFERAGERGTVLSLL